MKKLLPLVLLALLVSGCVSMTDPPVLNKSFPSAEKYEILGSVVWADNIYIVLGLIVVGGVGYKDLGKEASKKYGKVDDVVSVSVDFEDNGIWGILVQRRVTLRGIAIRYVKGAEAEGPKAEAE